MDDVELLSSHKIDEILIKSLRIDYGIIIHVEGLIAFLSWLAGEIAFFGLVRSINCQIPFVEFLLVEPLKWHGCHGRIWIVFLICHHHNEVGNVLFELSQVIPDVLLIKLGLIVVGLLAGNTRLKFSLDEHAHHLLNIVFDRIKFILHDVALIGGFLHVVFMLTLFVFQSFDFPLLLSLILFGQKLVLLYLLIEPLIVVFECISLLAEHIHIVEKTVILFFCLNECSDNLVNV